MKIWLFALSQSMIAVFGLAAYYWADNVLMATSAAVLAAALGIAQPLMTAHQARKMERYTDGQYQKSLDAVDEQVQEMLSNSIDPPLPHRATIASVIRQRFGENADELLDEYDCLIDEISAGEATSKDRAHEFAAQVAAWSLGPYLQGLSALAAGDEELAQRHFLSATKAQSTWIAPWLGWAAASYRLGQFNDIRERHPHACGVELLPYDAGDEDSFLELDESDRDELSEQFQAAAMSLGNYFAIAEFCRSKEQIAISRDELAKVA